MPTYSCVRPRFRETATALAKHGLLKNFDPRSWHPHALRASFDTEGAHAGVKKEVRGYFEGHLADIMYVYNNSDEIHPEDLQREYRRMERFVSLEPDKASIQAEFEAREKSLLSRIEKAEALLADLRKELGVSQTAQPRAAISGP